MFLNRRDFLVRGSALPLLARTFPSTFFADQTAKADEPAKSGFPGMITRMREPENLEFPFAELNSSITPNEHFFIRSHFAVPKVDAKSWKLTIDGAVKQKLEFTYDDLLKLPSQSLKATLECAGNGRVYLTPPVSGLQWGQGAVGNAEWTGVPLSLVLEKAGLKDAAVEVVLEGTDKGQINSDPKSPGPIAFARSIPIEKAKKPSVLLAFKMNGAELPVSHGFPIRAIVGGWYGVASVKWLARIVVVDKPYRGFFQTLDYSYWQRKDGLPTLLPVTEVEVKSAIARPSLGEVVPAGKPYRIFGAAWAGEAAIAKVEISTDGGKNWSAAKLLDKPSASAWSLWELSWNVPAQPGPARLMARATDANGRTQPLERDIDRRNYMISHVLPIDVIVR